MLLLNVNKETSTCLHASSPENNIRQTFSNSAAHNLPVATPISSRQPPKGVEINVVSHTVLIIHILSTVSM